MPCLDGGAARHRLKLHRLARAAAPYRPWRFVGEAMRGLCSPKSRAERQQAAKSALPASGGQGGGVKQRALSGVTR